MMVDRVRVGDVLELHRRAVEVKPDTEYREVGVRSFGRGIFHKEPIAGADLGNKRVFRIEPGDLVISNVFAWEGAIAVAADAEEDMIGSHRFMTFLPRDNRVDTAWIAWFFLSEPGLELIRRASPGSAGRNRTLAIERFEALEIPLPAIDEQRRVAELLDRTSQTTRQAERLAAASQPIDRALSDSRVGQLLDWEGKSWPLVRLSEVVAINPKPVRLDPAEPVLFVPMAAVNARHGKIDSPEVRAAGDIGAGYKQFRHGDVIFARITPCMQNGKSAIALDDVEFAFGSSEFHVLRPGQRALPEWIHRVVRSHRFRAMAARRFTGTAGQQRVPVDFLVTVDIPLPSVQEQRRIVAEIDAVVQYSESVRTLRSRSAELIASLIPAAMNEVFSALR